MSETQPSRTGRILFPFLDKTIKTSGEKYYEKNVKGKFFANPAKITITGSPATMDDENGNPAMKVTVSSSQVMTFLTMEAAMSFTQEQRIRYNNAFVTALAACGDDPHANVALPYTYMYHYENVSSGTAKSYVYFWKNDLSLQGVSLDVNKPSLWF